MPGRYEAVKAERRYWAWKAIGESDGLIKEDINTDEGDCSALCGVCLPAFMFLYQMNQVV